MWTIYRKRAYFCQSYSYLEINYSLEAIFKPIDTQFTYEPTCPYIIWYQGRSYLNSKSNRYRFARTALFQTCFIVKCFPLFLFFFVRCYTFHHTLIGFVHILGVHMQQTVHLNQVYAVPVGFNDIFLNPSTPLIVNYSVHIEALREVLCLETSGIFFCR